MLAPVFIADMIPADGTITADGINVCACPTIMLAGSVLTTVPWLRMSAVSMGLRIEPAALVVSVDWLMINNLKQVTVAGSQECNRSYTSDTFSRVTSSTEPEPGSGNRCPTNHTTHYYYTTSSGGLCSGSTSSVCRRTDARSTTTTYTYDALNRPTGMTYSDGSTPSVTYYYDQTSYNGLTITNGLGRRTGMLDGSGMTAWSYDANGNIVTEKRKIATVTKTISYAYNLDNSLKQLTYPSGRVVNFTVSNALPSS